MCCIDGMPRPPPGAGLKLCFSLPRPRPGPTEAMTPSGGRCRAHPRQKILMAGVYQTTMGIAPRQAPPRRDIMSVPEIAPTKFSPQSRLKSRLNRSADRAVLHRDPPPRCCTSSGYHPRMGLRRVRNWPPRCYAASGIAPRMGLRRVRGSPRGAAHHPGLSLEWPCAVSGDWPPEEVMALVGPRLGGV